jgi:hypothetical protein
MPPVSSKLRSFALALACASLCAGAAGAEPSHPLARNVAKAKSKAKAEPAPLVAAEPDEAEPDVAGTTTTEFSCELGNKITTYQNDDDDAHIALRWKKRLHRLTRVGTTTGAIRFENTRYGLVWIGIPSKGMLLDSKLNRQLANECKNPQQAKPVALDAAPAKNS